MVKKRRVAVRIDAVRIERPIKLYTNQDEYDLGKHSIENGLYRKGVWHFRNASHGGHVKSQYELASWIEDGTQSILKDPDEAVYWYRRAAKCGHDMSLFKLGLCYFYGIGIEMDLGLATSIFYETFHLDAKFLLAQCFLKGYGVMKDIHLAKQWCSYVAKKGHVQGKFYLKYLM